MTDAAPLVYAVRRQLLLLLPLRLLFAFGGLGAALAVARRDDTRS